jgi:hypothetical protein
LYTSSIPEKDAVSSYNSEFNRIAQEKGIPILTGEQEADMTIEQINEHYAPVYAEIDSTMTIPSYPILSETIVVSPILEQFNSMSASERINTMLNCGIACLPRGYSGPEMYSDRPYIAHLDDAFLGDMHRTGSLDMIGNTLLFDVAGGKLLGAAAKGISNFMSPTTLGITSKTDDLYRTMGLSLDNTGRYNLNEIGGYLAGKGSHQVTPGTKTVEGFYMNDLGRVEPWTQHYDDYGRIIARTDYNAGNLAQNIPATHHHIYGPDVKINPSKATNWFELESHIPGEYPGKKIVEKQFPGIWSGHYRLINYDK